MKPTGLRILCLAVGLTVIAPATAATYEITTITRDGFDELGFWGINNAGLVAGKACNAGCSVQTGFVYNSQTGVFTDLTGPTGALGSWTTDISDSGIVVGAYYTNTGSTSFIYEDGHYTDFHLPGAGSTFLRGISADARYLTGDYDGGNGFIFDRDTSTFVTIAPGIVQGINVHGVAAGSFIRPFLYDFVSRVQTYYTPDTDRYRDVNDHGIVTGGGLRDGYERPVAIVGAAGSAGMTVLSVEGSYEMVGYGINNDATVVGYYRPLADANTIGAFIATVVPEPGTWALLLCGLASLAAWRRRAGSPA